MANILKGRRSRGPPEGPRASQYLQTDSAGGRLPAEGRRAVTRLRLRRTNKNAAPIAAHSFADESRYPTSHRRPDAPVAKGLGAPPSSVSDRFTTSSPRRGRARAKRQTGSGVKRIGNPARASSPLAARSRHLPSSSPQQVHGFSSAASQRRAGSAATIWGGAMTTIPPDAPLRGER
jgi:hypothetical protein